MIYTCFPIWITPKIKHNNFQMCCHLSVNMFVDDFKLARSQSRVQREWALRRIKKWRWFDVRCHWSMLYEFDLVQKVDPNISQWPKCLLNWGVRASQYKKQCVLMLRSLYWPFLDTLNIGRVLTPNQTELSMRWSDRYKYGCTCHLFLLVNVLSKRVYQIQFSMGKDDGQNSGNTCMFLTTKYGYYQYSVVGKTPVLPNVSFPPIERKTKEDSGIDLFQQKITFTTYTTSITEWGTKHGRETNNTGILWFTCSTCYRPLILVTALSVHSYWNDFLFCIVSDWND